MAFPLAIIVDVSLGILSAVPIEIILKVPPVHLPGMPKKSLQNLQIFRNFPGYPSRSSSMIYSRRSIENFSGRNSSRSYSMNSFRSFRTFPGTIPEVTPRILLEIHSGILLEVPSRTSSRNFFGHSYRNSSKSFSGKPHKNT